MNNVIDARRKLLGMRAAVCRVACGAVPVDKTSTHFQEMALLWIPVARSVALHEHLWGWAVASIRSSWKSHYNWALICRWYATRVPTSCPWFILCGALLVYFSSWQRTWVCLFAVQSLTTCVYIATYMTYSLFSLVSGESILSQWSNIHVLYQSYQALWLLILALVSSGSVKRSSWEVFVLLCMSKCSDITMKAGLMFSGLHGVKHYSLPKADNFAFPK